MTDTMTPAKVSLLTLSSWARFSDAGLIDLMLKRREEFAQMKADGEVQRGTYRMRMNRAEVGALAVMLRDRGIDPLSI